MHRLDRLGVRFEISPDGGAIVYHNSESSLVVEVKSKQHLVLALRDSKESIIDKLTNHSSK